VSVQPVPLTDQPRICMVLADDHEVVLIEP